jgi:uncharacterized protein YjgD (DUF1641 family)
MLASEHLIYLRKISSELSEIILHARTVDAALVSKQIDRIHTTYDLVESIERLLIEERTILNKIKNEFRNRRITDQLENILRIGKNCINFDGEDLKKLVEAIIKIDVLIFQALTKPEKIAEIDPIFLEKIIAISKRGPYELFRKGFLCRGISHSDYEKLLQGHPIEGSSNFSVTPYQHILQRYNDNVVNSPFISLTSDPKTAMGWGDVLVIVSVGNIDGHIHEMEEIIKECHNDGKAMKFVKKNSEFLLGPRSGKVSKIPWQALVVA